MTDPVIAGPDRLRERSEVIDRTASGGEWTDYTQLPVGSLR
jgi:hypothetical protein